MIHLLSSFLPECWTKFGCWACLANPCPSLQYSGKRSCLLVSTWRKKKLNKYDKNTVSCFCNVKYFFDLKLVRSAHKLRSIVIYVIDRDIEKKRIAYLTAGRRTREHELDEIRFQLIQIVGRFECKFFQLNYLKILTETRFVQFVWLEFYVVIFIKKDVNWNI